MKQNRRFAFILAVVALSVMAFLPGKAEEGHEPTEKNGSVTEEHAPASFDAKKMIMDHILDAYEWHLFTIKGFHCSIPLPVILYSKEKGWNVFLSSKFHHGHKSYRGFHISKGEEYPGKVVEELSDGTVVRPLDLSLTKNAVAILFSVFLLLWLFIPIARSYKKRKNMAPHGLQNLLEPLILFIRDEVARPSIGEKYERYMPYLLTLFFFIFIKNPLFQESYKHIKK